MYTDPFCGEGGLPIIGTIRETTTAYRDQRSENTFFVLNILGCNM